MTEADLQELREFGEEITARTSAHEPRCVARMFASPLENEVRFTMQTWIDLEAIQSPIIRGEAFADAEEVRLAGAAFGLRITPESHTPEEAALVIEAMRDAITDGFAMGLKMKQEGVTGDGDNQGFGSWLPIYAHLVAECGVDPDAALRMPVGRALALIAARRHNQGWQVAGTMYAHRDVMDEEEAGHV